MKTIIEEAIHAFSRVHNKEHLALTECDCANLIARARDYEATIENRIKSEVAQFLADEKDRWVLEKNASPASAWIDSVFNHAIEYLEGNK